MDQQPRVPVPGETWRMKSNSIFEGAVVTIEAYPKDSVSIATRPPGVPRQIYTAAKFYELAEFVSAAPEQPKSTPPPVAAPSKGARLRVGDRVRLLTQWGPGNPSGTEFAIERTDADGGFGPRDRHLFAWNRAEGDDWERVPADNAHCGCIYPAQGKPCICPPVDFGKEGAAETASIGPNRKSAATIPPQPPPRVRPAGMSALEISVIIERARLGVDLAGYKHPGARSAVARAPEARSVVENASDMLDLLEDAGR